MMGTSQITRYLAMAALVIFILNGIISIFLANGVVPIPFPYFLLSLGAGLIVLGASGSFELSAIVTFILGGVMIYISSKKKEGFMTGNPVEIANRLKKVHRSQPKAPVGVYATGYVEAFEDLSDNAVPSSAPATTSAETKPAPVEKKETTGFKDASAPSQEGLFKLGVMPEETKGGFHIDQGTTVLNALNALKPDQVKQMSEDTQKLIDTQKSLMMMLGTMKPMLSDGKQLIDTFQQMFGPAGSQAVPQMSV
jgi:hypothetical protein